MDAGHSQNLGLNLAIVSSRPPYFGGLPSPWGLYPRQNQDSKWMLQVWLNVKFSSQPNLDNECIQKPKTSSVQLWISKVFANHWTNHSNKNHFILPPLFKPSQVFQTPNCPPLNPTHATIPFHPTQCFSQEEQISSVFPQKQLRKFWKIIFSLL